MTNNRLKILATAQLKTYKRKLSLSLLIPIYLNKSSIWVMPPSTLKLASHTVDWLVPPDCEQGKKDPITDHMFFLYFLPSSSFSSIPFPTAIGRSATRSCTRKAILALNRAQWQTGTKYLPNLYIVYK